MAQRTDIAVRFNEIDPYGHVNHSVYVTYLEVGRTDALTACGVPLELMAERGFQMVVTHIAVTFLQPAEAGQVVTVETAVGKLRRASGTWLQRILRGDDVLITAEVTAAVTDRRGKPVRPPDWLFPALEPLRGER